jgi:glyoxylase-like metal-dependent hydrolase (beta-lactamase superfamily II)
MTAPAARYRWRLLRAGPLRLDGGSMFGVIPRAVWGRKVDTDDQGRIPCAHNCLLLEKCNAGNSDRQVGKPAPQFVLIETGSGDKFDEKNRRIFGLTNESILTALAAEGVAPDSIRDVIVSHLHFDHAGGLTRRTTEADAAGKGGVIPTFPEARVIVQQREWQDAAANRSVMTRTYLAENLQPLRECLQLVNSPPPFDPRHPPGRDESPAAALQERVTEVLPGIDVFLIPGHTWGQQAIRFTDDRGRTVVFSADLIPTANHLGAAYNMAYDVEPYTSTVTRRWFLTEAAANDWLLVLDHEPGDPCRHVRPDGKGWFEWAAPAEGADVG